MRAFWLLVELILMLLQSNYEPQLYNQTMNHNFTSQHEGACYPEEGPFHRRPKARFPIGTALENLKKTYDRAYFDFEIILSTYNIPSPFTISWQTKMSKYNSSQDVIKKSIMPLNIALLLS